MPPKKKHKPLEGQTWLRFANKRPSKGEEHRDENLQDERKTIGGADKQSRKQRKLWKLWLKSTRGCFMSKMEISCSLLDEKMSLTSKRKNFKVVWLRTWSKNKLSKRLLSAPHELNLYEVQLLPPVP